MLYELGLAYFKFEKYKKSLTFLKQALTKNPYPSYLPDIYYHIGLSYAREEKFEKAIFPLTKSIELIPSDVRYLHERAKTYQMIDYQEQAIKDFNKVIKRNPKNAHAYFRRAFSLKALKIFDKAAEDFEKAANLDPYNPLLVINHKQLKGVNCIVLCEPGNEKVFA